MNSRTKGIRGELEFAKLLSECFGIEARRGQQYCGSSESPDVVTDITGVHFEVKRVQALNLQGAMAQATKDSGENDVACVASRKDRQEWLLTIKAKDLIKFCERILAKECKKQTSNES